MKYYDVQKMSLLMVYRLTDDNVYYCEEQAMEIQGKGKSHLSIVGGRDVPL